MHCQTVKAIAFNSFLAKATDTPLNPVHIGDLVSDANAFKRGHSAINHLTIKHRHLQCNLLFTTQYLKAIPPVIRRNIDIWVVFKFANAQSVVDHIYPEISAYVKEDEFKALFEYSTETRHDSLIIDLTSKSNNMFKKNWDTALSVSNW